MVDDFDEGLVLLVRRVQLFSLLLIRLNLNNDLK